AQCEFQALAFKDICGIGTVRLFDSDPIATDKAVFNLKDSGLTVIRTNSHEECVSGADIITTCTADKQYATILTDNMVGTGIHINAIGGDCPGKTELHKDILLRSDIFVEFPPQTRVEGEIQQLDADHPVTELWQVITGDKQGRTDDQQITLFDSVGFAIEDFSALKYLYGAIKNTRFYDELDMIADPDEP
ncbi:MAG: ornithine cyclodeaminase, partial [Cohaesibacter sp.]|nr:ornithine cyclodeaminase [Cohaesibacter sp.]